MHLPLAFLSGEATGAEPGCVTFEKERFAITKTFSRLHYMLQCEPLRRIFKHHRNLLFVFQSSLLDQSLWRHKVTKVLRWAMFLSHFACRIEHVDGECKLIPDILTHLFHDYRVHRASIKPMGCRILEHDIAPSPVNEYFSCPDFREPPMVQDRHQNTRPKRHNENKTNINSTNDRVRVPAEAQDLQRKLLITAHRSYAGHRRIE